MLALAMIVTAVMVVPGDVPGKVSEEMAREAEPLDLSGEWKGNLHVEGKESEPETEVMIKNGRMTSRSGRGQVSGDIEMLSNQGGKVRFKWGTKTFLGIYQQQGDRLLLCLRRDDKGRKGYPTSFRACADQALIIFHRVKTNK